MIIQEKNMPIFKYKDIELKELLMIIKMTWECQIIKSETGLVGTIISHW